MNRFATCVLGASGTRAAQGSMTMTTRTFLCMAACVVATPGSAEQRPYPLAKVSYDDFTSLVAEVEPHRRERLVDLDTFLKMSRQPGVVILDTRSAFRYERIHLKGAKHLSFPDFTQDNLRKVIPSPDTVVLIYCNNNFDGNEVDFASKVAGPRGRPLHAGDVASAGAVASTDAEPARPLTRADRDLPASPKAQVKVQEKPVMLALNVPTYITLYGYGYRNIYELGELVKVSDPRVSFEGTVVGKE